LCLLAGDQMDDDPAGSSSSQHAGSGQHGESEGGDSQPADTPSESDGSGPTEPAQPQAVLVSGRRAGGYGLEWNPQKQNILLAGDSAGGVQLWDVAAACSSSSGSGGSNGASSRVAPRVSAVQVRVCVKCGLLFFCCPLHVSLSVCSCCTSPHTEGSKRVCVLLSCACCAGGRRVCPLCHQ
jgi:hypothetical protein